MASLHGGVAKDISITICYNSENRAYGIWPCGLALVNIMRN